MGQQMKRAIQESLNMSNRSGQTEMVKMQFGQNENENAVQLQHSGDGAMAAMLRMDPALQRMDPAQRKKVVKQRLKAQEEAAFQESIRDLSEMEKQRAILLRIQEKNERKKAKQQRRKKMLNDPSADQIAQQQAIMAQISMASQPTGAAMAFESAAPPAFTYQ